MKICVLSNKGEALNEGQRNMAARLDREFRHEHEVLHLNAKEALCTAGGWRALKSFRPDVVHFFLRPSLRTFAAAKVVQSLLRGTPVVFSAVQPPAGSRQAKFLHLVAPKVVFCLTEATEREFRALGLQTRRMLFGVDSERFTPVSPGERSRLKEKFGLAPAVPVALHVGHLTRGRNIDALVCEDRDQPFKLLVVASPMFPADKKFVDLLNRHRTLVIHEHLENIQEVYQVADIYLFPTINRSNCIDAPLSVLEAMAVNLPVITTRFGVLASGFDGVDGLHFVEDPQQIPSMTRKVLAAGERPSTREKVFPYSWANAAKNLVAAYKDISNES